MQSPLIAVAIAAAALLVLALGVLGLDRTSQWCMVAAFALAPCVEFTFPGFRFFNVSDALFILAIATALPRLMARHLWLPTTFVLGSLAFVTVSVLASLQSATPGESYYYAARVILMLIGIPALLVWWSPRGRFLVTLVLAYAAGTGASVLVGLAEPGGSRSLGLTTHPNILGYTALLTLSLVPFLSRALTRHRALICTAVLGVSFVGIMTSGSRAALVTAIVLLVLVPAAERSILTGVSVLTAGVVAVLIVGQRKAGEGQDALSRLLGEGDIEGSNKERVQGVETVWSLALDHPLLGSGFNFGDFAAHNGYVQVAAAAGFIGLAAFAGVCLSMVTPLLKTPDVHSRLAYPTVAFLIAAPVSPNLTDRYIGFLMGLSMVGVVAMHQARRGRDPVGRGELGDTAIEWDTRTTQSGRQGSAPGSASLRSGPA